MSVDIVDDLHAAEDMAGLLADALEKVVAFSENQPWTGLADADDVSLMGDVIVAVAAWATYCRPSCQFREEGECHDEGNPDLCGCPCGHADPDNQGDNDGTEGNDPTDHADGTTDRGGETRASMGEEDGTQGGPAGSAERGPLRRVPGGETSAPVESGASMRYGMNVVAIAGRLSRPAERRVLPDGSEIVAYEVTTPGRGADRDETVPVVWFDAPASASNLDVDDRVVVVGRVRRRFFRAGGSTQSRTEVVADAVVPARNARRVRAALDAAAGMLLEDSVVSS